MELRRDFLGSIGPRVYGDRGFVVCGVVLDDPLGVEPPDANGVHTASVTWEQLAAYDPHSAGEELSRYLTWAASRNAATQDPVELARASSKEIADSSELSA